MCILSVFPDTIMDGVNFKMTNSASNIMTVYRSSALSEGQRSVCSALRVTPWEGRARGHADGVEEGDTWKVQGEEAIVDCQGDEGGEGEHVRCEGELNTYCSLGGGCIGGDLVYVCKGNA
jgi:hypothetical protein